MMSGGPGVPPPPGRASTSASKPQEARDPANRAFRGPLPLHKAPHMATHEHHLQASIYQLYLSADHIISIFWVCARSANAVTFATFPLLQIGCGIGTARAEIATAAETGRRTERESAPSAGTALVCHLVLSVYWLACRVDGGGMRATRVRVRACFMVWSCQPVQSPMDSPSPATGHAQTETLPPDCVRDMSACDVSAEGRQHTLPCRSQRGKEPEAAKRERTPPPARRAASPRKPPEYAVKVASRPSNTLHRDYMDLVQRYTRLYVPADFAKCVSLWTLVSSCSQRRSRQRCLVPAPCLYLPPLITPPLSHNNWYS